MGKFYDLREDFETLDRQDAGTMSIGWSIQNIYLI